jgi:renalase
MRRWVETETVIVGAGIAGLACARSLVARGRTPLVLERSRGVGGRCATRRFDGQPVDHGAAFVHGSDPRFLGAARAVRSAAVLEGWPRKIEGDGPPCLPKAFDPREERFAYAEGMTALPKGLADGLDVRLECPVDSLAARGGRIVLRSEAGEEIAPDHLVLALPAPASRRLLAPWAGEEREASAVLRLLDMVGTQACLTLIAGYGPSGVPPDWDILYPGGSTVVQAVSHDSAKRRAPAALVLVVQARPCWSLRHGDDDPASWARELLAETARLVGSWAGEPAWSQPHRWRYARTDRGSEMSRPLAVRLPGGTRVIVTGESFAPGGGIEAAWLAGNASAARLLEEE